LSRDASPAAIDELFLWRDIARSAHHRYFAICQEIRARERSCRDHVEAIYDGVTIPERFSQVDVTGARAICNTRKKRVYRQT